MAEHFGFFDAVQDPNGLYDREYNAEQFTIPFDALITNGVVRSAYEQLEVVTSGSNMVSQLKSGIAFIEGHHYFNDGNVELTHDVEVLGMSRIDRVVIRKDSNPESRYVKAFIKKGLPSANPVPPTLTRNEYIYEISLAQVRVVGGQGFISNIIDERGTVNIGPWAGSDILPSYDDNLLARHVENRDDHIRNGERIAWNNKVDTLVNYAAPDIDPNTTLFSSILTAHENKPPNGYFWIILTNFFNAIGMNNGRTQLAIGYSHNNIAFRSYTPGVGWSQWSQVGDPTNLLTKDKSSLVNAINELFTSVSNGKSLVANAITQKGVNTSPTAEFATMASNISKIQTSNSTHLTGLNAYVNGATTVFPITGLAFRPEGIFINCESYVGQVIFDGAANANECRMYAYGKVTSGRWDLITGNAVRSGNNLTMIFDTPNLATAFTASAYA